MFLYNISNELEMNRYQFVRVSVNMLIDFLKTDHMAFISCKTEGLSVIFYEKGNKRMSIMQFSIGCSLSLKC